MNLKAKLWILINPTLLLLGPSSFERWFKSYLDITVGSLSFLKISIRSSFVYLSLPPPLFSLPAHRHCSASHVQYPCRPSAALSLSTYPPLPRRRFPRPRAGRFCSPHVALPPPELPRVPPALPAPARARNAPPGLKACSAIALRIALLPQAPQATAFPLPRAHPLHWTFTATTTHRRQPPPLLPIPDPKHKQHPRDPPELTERTNSSFLHWNSRTTVTTKLQLRYPFGLAVDPLVQGLLTPTRSTSSTTPTRRSSSTTSPPPSGIPACRTPRRQ
jgi:hypothetical protein